MSVDVGRAEEKLLAPVYDPFAVEGKCYAFWEEQGVFRANADSEAPSYSIVIPPPNVTGSLHMGHALDNTLQDVLIRWKRMLGYEVLWLPGTDHAGIATQHVVEKRLLQEGTSRQELGREKFLERVWKWKNEYEATILNQLRRLGASCDWSRTRFTMDEGCSQAVKKVFVSLYKNGLIYRGDYIINWCPECGTALSDLEVEHKEVKGALYYIRYPVVSQTCLNGESRFDGEIVVATTRPETMLGDTAVAVHPEDHRHRALVGRTALLPIMKRLIPIIADAAVEQEFGTGCVKVTPAHDPADFEIGRRHGLPAVSVIGKDARMTAEAGCFKGMDRYDCRKAVIQELERLGYLVKVEEHVHSIGHCYRCGSVVEPLVSRQWFVKMSPLARAAIQAVKEERIKFVPERFSKLYLHWMENVRDWCISRQIWWGHRIPAWYCKKCGEILVEENAPAECENCGSSELEQDPDVLDTWFSSALWPFSTMGWPEDTKDLRKFFPTSVLVTGYDIIFFWVARMIVMSLNFMNDVPFRHVLIHGLVRDESGQKMSKSRGTGVDPLEVIDKYGADTLRFTLIRGNTPGNDMRFQWDKVESSRNFCNKLWNAARFVLMNLNDFEPEQVDVQKVQSSYTTQDKWILSRLSKTIEQVTAFLDDFEIGEAARVLYDFVWSEYCDWYIELVKPRLYGKLDPETRKTAQYVVLRVLESTLRLLHPFMPFITEALWQSLPVRENERRPLAVSAWPRMDEPGLGVFAEAESKMDVVMNVVKAIRNLRSEIKLHPTREAPVQILTTSQQASEALTEAVHYVELLTSSRVTFLGADLGKPKQAIAAITPGAEIYLPLRGLIDVEGELRRLQKELDEAKASLNRFSSRLSDPSFLSKAPPHVVEKERERYEMVLQKVQGLERRISQLQL